MAGPEQDQTQGQAGQEQGPCRVQAREWAAQRVRVDAQHGEEGADGEQGRQRHGEHQGGHAYAQGELCGRPRPGRCGDQQREADLDDLAEVVQQADSRRARDRAA
ncbi:hypothetical protein [Streptomyces sp. NRRL S-646]|uniref:hypothetical protein n=1 Tax=Streptomyces sp. NRRL S-646 TaxID=1463917 RepID=UPI001331291C|nr:hypothetical protein [Streptomyces sp. NRRL S-646]